MIKKWAAIKYNIFAIIACIFIHLITSCSINDAPSKYNMQTIGISPYVGNVYWGISYNECLEQGIVGEELNEVSTERTYLSTLLNKITFFDVNVDQAYLGFAPQFQTQINDVLKMHNIEPFDDTFYLNKVYLYFNMSIDQLLPIIQKIPGIELVENIPGQYYRWESTEKINDLNAYDSMCSDIYNWLYATREQEKSINSMTLYNHDGNSTVCIRGEEAVIINYIRSNM